MKENNIKSDFSKIEPNYGKANGNEVIRKGGDKSYGTITLAPNGSLWLNGSIVKVFGENTLKDITLRGSGRVYNIQYIDISGLTNQYDTIKIEKPKPGAFMFITFTDISGIFAPELRIDPSYWGTTINGSSSYYSLFPASSLSGFSANRMFVGDLTGWWVIGD